MITVRWAHVKGFDGPRHERLYTVWRRFAAANADCIRVRPFRNIHGLSHGAVLALMWNLESQAPGRYCVLTEHDFLPHPEDFAPLRWLTPERPVVACHYATRNSRGLIHEWPYAGAWYILIDKVHAPRDLDLLGRGRHNDPANGLVAGLHAAGKDATLLHGEDCRPAHFGVRYATGTHLFWSRHYQDPPDRVVAGVRLGDVQAGVDHALDDYEQIQTRHSGNPALGARTEA